MKYGFDAWSLQIVVLVESRSCGVKPSRRWNRTDVPLYAPVATVPVPRHMPVLVADVMPGASSLKTMLVSACSIGIEVPEKSIVQLRTVVDVERWLVSAGISIWT